MTIRIDSVNTSRGKFGIRRLGFGNGKRVLCLHGFPDDASTFDGLSSELSIQDFDVAALYLRGYDPSVLEGPYDLGLLVEDLLAVLDTLGWSEPVYLIGHDYGAQIGFAALAQHPRRFQAAVALSGAHPAAIAKNTRRHPRQIWMSRYIIFFQLGGIADRRVARNGYQYIERLWKRWSPTFELDRAHRNSVIATIDKSMPAPIAMYRGGGFGIGPRPISVPTLFITGADDGCVLPQMSDGQELLFSSAYEREVWERTGHFPHLEHPERTSAAVERWFANS